MCGIAGFAAPDEYPPMKDLVRSMASSLRRRGPDSEGFSDWQRCAFGHRRLAILDLSDAGRQPMLSDDGEIGVTFNGCIYNFQDLRAKLEARGYRFRSNTDTEVLVHGYAEWGANELVRRLRGMFAFAIWDNRRQRLTLVRDRLGVKPLVYWHDGRKLAFASTVAALHDAGLVNQVDEQSILEYLEFGFIPEPRTVYRNAVKLPPGCLLEWEDGRITHRQYWSLPETDESSKITFEEAVEETERLLVESVRLRLYADVPIGALLSEGIDSALVCWAMAKLNANVKAFTISTEGDPSDEAPGAAETARLLGIPHEVVTLPRDDSAFPGELTDAWGEPFGCSSGLAMLRVSRAVKPMATVLLTGDGGDDVFLGYPFQRNFYNAQRVARWVPNGAGAVWKALRPVVGAAPFLRRPKHFLDYAVGGLGAVTQVHDGLPYYWRRNMLGERLHGTRFAGREIPWSQRSARRLLPEVLHYEQQTRFVGEFMAKVDGSTMFHGLEARSPFLDHELWEFAARLPAGIRLHNGTLKAILREIVRRKIGSAAATRQKRGFTVPVGKWLTTRWSTVLEDVGENSSLERGRWFVPASVQSAVREAIRQKAAPNQLWYILVLEHWMRAYEARCGLRNNARAEINTPV